MEAIKFISKITVINRKTAGKIPYNTVRFYVGRPSPLGNPFEIGKDGTREEVIDKYRTWIDDKLSESIDNPRNRNAQWNEHFTMWAVATHIDVELECWCAPLPCHADIIKELIDPNG